MSPDTINLIGMPGAGKSTIGVILAKRCGLRFVDTDLEIQLKAGATLQEILERDGYRQLRALEEDVLLSVDLSRAVIATGGSVVYSAPAMARLKAAGPVIYLQADLPTLEQRVAAAPPRGIACDTAQQFPAIFTERTPLYSHFADLTVNAGGGTPESVVAAILRELDTLC